MIVIQIVLSKNDVIIKKPSNWFLFVWEKVMDLLNGETTIERMLIKQSINKHRPVSATLELTPLCNMNCDMCYVHLNNTEMKRHGKMLETDEWLKIIEQIKSAGVLFIMITGGEPLLYPGFKEIYLKLKELGMIVTVNTNGTLIDEKWADFFDKNKPRRINITLYGSSEDTYLNLCHFQGFDKTVKGIKLLKEKDIKIKINGSIVKANYHQIDEIYEIADELEIPVHMDTYMLPGLKDYLKDYEKQSRLNPKDASKAQIKVLKKELGNNVFKKYVKETLKTIETANEYPCYINCQAANSSFMIDWKGQMKPCVSLFEPAVDIRKAGFENGWKKLRELSQRLVINEECGKCRLITICNTCVASARWETGSYEKIGEYNCIYSKELLKLLILENEH